MDVPDHYIAYFFIKFPKRSQIFFVRELQALAQLGTRIEVHCLWGSPELSREELSLPPRVTLHPLTKIEFLQAPLRLLWEMAGDPTLLRSARKWMQKARFRKLEDGTMLLFGLLLAFARVGYFRKRPPLLFHGAWATAPATAAAILARLCRKPFSFGAHAYDLYRGGGDAFLLPKLEKARFVHASTLAAKERLASLYPEAASKIIVARRGLIFLPEVPARESAQGARLHILSVGRLVPKKGWEIQIRAAGLLKEKELPFELAIVGTGVLESRLRNLIQQLRLGDTVFLVGERPYRELEKFYKAADLFWFTGIPTPDGDRDGFPNVVAEAWAYALPVVTTGTGAIQEALVHGKNGYLLPEPTPEALATATLELWRDPDARKRLGLAGRKWVEEHYMAIANALRLREAMEKTQNTPC